MLFNTQSQPASLPPGPTPSGQLSDSIRNMCLASQGLERPPLAPSLRPPVPLFSETQPTTQQLGGPGHPGSGGPPPSQMDYMGTQDFITPADQFDLVYDPSQAAAAQAGRPPRSPVALSPGRIKRARKSDPENEPVAGSHPLLSAPLGPLGRRPGGVGVGTARIARPRVAQPPPAYRSIFNHEETDADSLYVPWTKDRPSADDLPKGRYRLEFKEVGYMGAGSFSKVESMRHRLDGMQYAIKRSLRALYPGSDEFSQFLQEVQVLAKLPPHPNVVRYYGSWTEASPIEGDQDHLFMQLELCDGSLKSTWGAEAMREADIIDIALQIAAGLAHCHRHGVAHLDVKPENIFTLISNKGSSAPRYTYKLGDFGQAARLHGAGGCTVPEGDARYIPLERMNGKVDALDKADMFALGIVMFELAATSTFELPREGQVYQDLRRGNPPMLPTRTSTFRKIVKALLAENPADRPSAERALKMLSKAAAGGKGTQETASPAPVGTAEPMQS